LNKSLDYKMYNSEIAADCLYWKAEAYYSTNEFISAIKYYQEFIRTPGVGRSKHFSTAYYNLGYCEFELDVYTKAIKWFRKYEQLMKGKSSDYLTDVQNRIGDCYFLDRNYEKASEYYSKAAEARNWSTDYAVYQNALSRGLSGQLNKKIALLKNFSEEFPGSEYRDDALFELAKAKTKKGDENAALAIYNKLISDYPNSVFMAKSLLQLGQLNYNRKNYPEAIKNYKQVILAYAESSEAKSALVGMKNVYIDMNNVQAYFTFAESLGMKHAVDLSEKDSLTYLSAERLYMDGENEKSVDAFSDYLKEFPDGMFRTNAAYYRGEAAFNREDYNEALLAFEMVLENGDNLFTEKALLGASQLYLKQKDFLKAKNTYQLLKQKTKLVENKRIADWGLFRSYYELKKHDDLIALSRELMLSSKVNTQEKREILYKRAKTYLALNHDDLAKKDLQSLAKEVQSPEGAESRFLLAKLLYRNKKNVEAEKRINEFIEMNSPHHFWLGKSFILLSDVFIEKKDLFQARYTLQSVIDNYSLKDDGIIEAAKLKLETIIEGEKVKESSLKQVPVKTAKKAVNKKSISKEHKHLQKTKKDSLSVSDAKSMLNEMVGELDD